MADTLTVNGSTYALDTQAGRDTLAADVAKMGDGDTLVIENAIVFTPGWNRNGIAPHPAQLAKYAKTAKGTPILRNHTDELLGANRSMSYDKDRGLLQTMAFDAPKDGSQGLMQRMLALKVIPRFSISWLRSEGSKVECSECHKDMLDYTAPYEERCHHYPGERLSKGGTVQGWVTDSQHAETSVTFTPAATGTGLADEDTIAKLSDEIREHRLSELRDRLSTAPAPVPVPDPIPAPSPDPAAVALTEQLASANTDRQLLGEQLRTMTTERDSLAARVRGFERADTLRIVQQYRARKGLSLAVTDDALVSLYEANPTAVKALWDATPDSALCDRQTGIQPIQPDAEIDSYATLAERASAMAVETKQPYEVCWRKLRGEMSSSEGAKK